METKQTLRIVVASSGNVRSERNVLRATIDQLNREQEDRGVYLDLIMWETDEYPDFLHGIEDCDLFIGIFWTRFGATTQSELMRAYESFKDNGKPKINIYFKDKPYSPRSKVELDEWGRVLEFRQRFPEEGLWWSFKSKAQFTRLIREHLTFFIWQHNEGPFSGAVANSDDLVRIYRHSLYERLNKMYSVGDAQHHSLKDVFIDLSLIQHDQSLQIADAQQRTKKALFQWNEFEELNAKRRGYVVSSESLLHNRTNTVVIGAPGSGKTTLLKYLTLKVLDSDKRIPVFVELRSVWEMIVTERRNSFADLLFDQGVAPHLPPSPEARAIFKNQFLRNLEAGEVIIFLDGLDEIGDGSVTRKIIDAMNSFRHSVYGKSKILISSRPDSYQSSLDGFSQLEILPLSRRKINQFLRHYLSSGPETIGIIESIGASHRLRGLAQNPLLLATITQIYRQMGSIPLDQLTLYRETVEQLVTRWDPTKRSTPPEFRTHSDPVVRLEFLEYLAYEQLVASRLKSTTETAQVVMTGEAIIRNAQQFVEKSKVKFDAHLLAGDAKLTPLLQQVNPDAYAFIHRSLQEYLAASALSKRDDRKEIVARLYFDPTLAESELLPMTLGLVSSSDELYDVLERFPDSLRHVNLRVRARGLAYTSRIAPAHVNPLIDTIGEMISERTGPEPDYANTILRSFSFATGFAQDALVNRVIPLFKGGGPFLSFRAALALGEIGGKRALQELLNGLQSSQGTLKTDAALALGKFNDPQAIDGLVQALNDESGVTRWFAAESLGAIGSTEALDSLFPLLNDTEHYVRWAVAEAIGRIDGRETLERLNKLVTSDNSRCGPVALALAIVGESRAVELLVRVLMDEDAELRSRAAAALERFGDERAVEALLTALEDSSVEVRANAADALGKIGGQRATTGLINALNRKFEDDKVDVYWRIAKALGEIGGDQSARALIGILEGSPYVGARWRAAEALGRLGRNDAEHSLLKALNDQDIGVRKSAAVALGQLGNRQVLSQCLKALDDSDELLRMRAAEALGEIGNEDGVIALLGALNSTHVLLPRIASEALNKIVDKVLVKGLLKALSAKDAFVRQKAVEVVGYYSNSEQTLKELSRLAANDPIDKVRTAASQARDSFYLKLQLMGAVVSALPIAEQVGRESALEETRAFIAHEIKSAIGPLRVMAQVLEEQLGRPNTKNEELASLTKRILKQTEKAYEVVNQYVDYTKPLTLSLAPTQMTELVQDVLDEFEVDLNKRLIKIRFQSEAHLARANVDRTLIAQVFRNIVLNAIEAMDSNGELFVNLSSGRDSIIIEVCDTGPGIRAQDQPRMFELGFTTKLGRHGAGVGLALSRRVVEEAHGGRIDIKNNNNGVGTVVTIELPVFQKERSRVR